MSIYAFGDIHGEIFKLKALMARLPIKDGDELVFLGDYIDRGRWPYEVIEYLIGLDKQYNCIFLMGNHEQMLVDFLSGIYERMFIHNGGFTTVRSYRNYGYDLRRVIDYRERTMPKEHKMFFLNLKYYYETENYIFVHAGIEPNVPMKKQELDVILWDHQFSFTNYTGKTVVYGHLPNHKILNEKHRICIDTGACFESMGDLTCVKLPEREFTRQGWTINDT